MLTTRCDLACAYCTQRRLGPRDMSPETLDAAVDLVAASGHARPELVLFGGEPLLAAGLARRALERLAERARPGLAPGARVVTNGLRLDDATIDLLARHDVALDLSCDGPGEPQERRGRGSWAVVRALLLRLASGHPAWLASRVAVRTTVDSGNVGALASSLEALVGLGVRHVHATPVNTPDPGWDDSSAEALDVDLGRVAESSLGRTDAGGRRAFAPFRPGAAGGGVPGGPSCSLGRPDVLFVDVDGSVAPCGALADSVHPALPPLAEAIRGPLRGAQVCEAELARSLRRRADAASRLPSLRGSPARRSPRGGCASCDVRDECFVCPAAVAVAPDQDPDLVPAISCDWNRLVARHRREFLARGAARRDDAQRAGRSSSAAETSAVTPARIAGS